MSLVHPEESESCTSNVNPQLPIQTSNSSSYVGKTPSIALSIALWLTFSLHMKPVVSDHVSDPYVITGPWLIYHLNAALEELRIEPRQFMPYVAAEYDEDDDDDHDHDDEDDDDHDDEDDDDHDDEDDDDDDYDDDDDKRKININTSN
ncbi:nucleophosmin-like [Battus philenor]|uniref:nucleophosmin-like n=1 Tax=Battus philenor TaxID=42288 RepID=UPI0035D095F9